MVSDAEKIISFLFKRSGKLEINYSELYLTLSIKLNWFKPEKAKDFINKSIEKKLLKKKDEMISPSFNINKIDVPLGFYPQKNLFKDISLIQKSIEEKDIFKKIIQKIKNKTKINEKNILLKIKNIENEKDITREVAAMIFAIEHNVFLEEYYEEIENAIYLENKK